MGDRARIRVGRDVTYLPTDVEATAGGGDAGDQWPAKIVDGPFTDGTVNLHVFEPDGTTLAKTAVAKGDVKGTFTLLGTGPQAL